MDFCVIPSALSQRTVAVCPRPRRATVVGPKHAAGIGLDVRPEAIRVRAGHGDADVAPDPLGQPGIARDLRPVVATVRRLEQAAAPAA